MSLAPIELEPSEEFHQLKRARALSEESSSSESSKGHLHWYGTAPVRGTNGGVESAAFTAGGGAELASPEVIMKPREIEVEKNSPEFPEMLQGPPEHTFMFQLPRVSQFIYKGELYLDDEERKATWSELFWDLVFVGCLIILADGVLIQATWKALGQYVLLFVVVFRIWSDMHYWLNITSADDTLQLMHFIWKMVLMVGLSVTAKDALEASGGLFALFYFFSRITLVLMYTLLDWNDPRFRCILTYYRIIVTTSAVVWLVSSFLSPVPRTILWCVSFIIDSAAFSFALLACRQKWLPSDDYALAIHHEHHIERLGTFVIIVLGETVLALFYRNNSSSLDLRYFKAALGLSITFNLYWIYFRVDGGLRYVHALKRHGMAGLLWSNFHLPLTATIAAMGGSMKELVADRSQSWLLSPHGSESHGSVHAAAENSHGTELTEDLPVHAPVIWIFCVSCALTLAIMAFMGTLHKSLDEKGETRISKNFRIASRVAMAVIWILVPLTGLGSLGVLVFLAVSVLPVTFLEAWGRVKKKRKHVAGHQHIWRSHTYRQKVAGK